VTSNLLPAENAFVTSTPTNQPAGVLPGDDGAGESWMITVPVTSSGDVEVACIPPLTNRLAAAKGCHVELRCCGDRYRANTAFHSAFMSTTVQPYFLAASRAVVNVPATGGVAS
jgi:hypothetical protein